MLDMAMEEERIRAELIGEIMSITPNADRNLVEQQVRDGMQEFGPLIRSGLISITRAFLPPVFSKAKDQVAPRVVEKQVDILKNGIPESKRLDEYLRLHWSISRYEAGSLILGDVGPIGVNQKGEVIPPLFESELHSVLLPLSSDMLLTGSIDSEPLMLSSSEMNALSSAMSIGLFVASNNSADVARCIGHFGTKSDQFYKEIVDGLSGGAHKGE